MFSIFTARHCAAEETKASRGAVIGTQLWRNSPQGHGPGAKKVKTRRTRAATPQGGQNSSGRGQGSLCLHVSSLLSLKNFTYEGQELLQGLEERPGTGRKFWKEDPGQSQGISKRSLERKGGREEADSS